MRRMMAIGLLAACTLTACGVGDADGEAADSVADASALPVARWESDDKWAAGEVIFADDGTYTFQSDVWSTGSCVGTWIWDRDRISTRCDVEGRTVRRTFRLAGDDALIESGPSGDTVYVPA